MGKGKLTLIDLGESMDPSKFVAVQILLHNHDLWERYIFVYGGREEDKGDV